MATVEGTQPEWRRSSNCMNGECVEVATCHGHVLIRDSAELAGPVLMFAADQWRCFARGISGQQTRGLKFSAVESLCGY